MSAISSLTAVDASAIAQARVAQDVQVAVLRESNDAARAEGQAVVQLIEAAAEVASFAPGRLDVRA